MKRNLRLDRRAWVAVLVLGSAATVAACGEDGAAASGAPASAEEGSADTPEAPAATTGVVVPVVALDNSFRPQALEVHVGDTVTWENRGNNDHNVLSVETGEWGAKSVTSTPHSPVSTESTLWSLLPRFSHVTVSPT